MAGSHSKRTKDQRVFSNSGTIAGVCAEVSTGMSRNQVVRLLLLSVVILVTLPPPTHTRTPEV
jgi:hypothetical protein